MNKYLFLMLGYPGSGKTTLSKIVSDKLHIARISSDELRKYMFSSEAEITNVKLNPYVFGVLDYFTVSSLKAGNSIIYDVNNNRRKGRQRKVKLSKRYSASCIVVWVDTSKPLAKARENTRQNDPDYLPIPSKRFEQLTKALQPPTPPEKVIKIDGTNEPSQQLQDFLRQLKEIDKAGN